MLSYLSYATGAELQTAWGADPGSPEMQRISEQSVKGQELYQHFWTSRQ